MNDKMILGKNSIFNYNDKINNNAIVFAATGCGKTKSIVEPTLLYTNDSSLVVSLAKRELFEQYAYYFQNKGYEVLDLDFTSPYSPFGYDPFAYIENDEDIITIANIITSFGSNNIENSSDPYWIKAAATFLSAIIGLIKQYDFNPLHIHMTETPGIFDKPTFLDVLDIYHNIGITYTRDEMHCELDYLFEGLEKKEPGNFAYRCYTSIKGLPAKTFFCINSIISTALNSLFTPAIQELIKKKRQIDITKLGERKSILFLTTSPISSSIDAFTTLFYRDLFKGLYNHAQSKDNYCLKVPVKIICDDFAVTTPIPDFSKYISVFRSSGISAILLLQSESQLNSLYGSSDATTIINNCDSYIYMGGNDLKTAENISRRANVPLEEVLYMPIGRVMIFRRGSKPIITDRYPIFEDEKYNEMEKERERIIRELEK